MPSRAPHAALTRATEALAALAQDERRARERYDDACFTVREIEDARLQPGEDERLDERAPLPRQRRADRDGSAGGAPGAGGRRGRCARSARRRRGRARQRRTLRLPLWAKWPSAALALQAEAGDLATELARALDADRVRSRRARDDQRAARAARSAQAQVRLRLRRARRARATAAANDRRVRKPRSRSSRNLEHRQRRPQRELDGAAAALTRLRKSAASALRKRVLAEFADIALGSGSFDVAFEPLERAGAQGAERVEFLFAANAGEPARPLARVASGGELSRVLLALVVVLSGARDAGGALVFDEIDAAIGGATATAVGARIGDARAARTGRLRDASRAARDLGASVTTYSTRQSAPESRRSACASLTARKNARPRSRACSRARPTKRRCATRERH